MPAIIVGAVISAAITMEGASSASDKIQTAAELAIGTQKQAGWEQKQLQEPFVNLGKDAIPTLENLLGINKPGQRGAGPSPQQTLEGLPGYQFAKTQGIDAAKAGGASMGMALSGNTLQGITDRATGLADQTYGDEINRLMGIAGLGESAAANLSGNIGARADQISGIQTGKGGALAGIDLNEAASLASIVGNVTGSGNLTKTLSSIKGG